MVKMIPGSNCGLDSNNGRVNQNCVPPSHRQYVTCNFNSDYPLDWVLDRAVRDGYYIQQIYFQDHYNGQVIAWMHKVPA